MSRWTILDTALAYTSTVRWDVPLACLSKGSKSLGDFETGGFLSQSDFLEAICLGQWFPTLGNADVLGLQLPETPASTADVEGFGGVEVQEHPSYPWLRTIAFGDLTGKHQGDCISSKKVWKACLQTGHNYPPAIIAHCSSKL